jgi:4-hydroxy-tetrahydrodipicolinate synthase
MLKHEDASGLAKLTRVREGEKKPGRRRVSILVGNGGLHYPQELRRGADGAMTGFAWPEMLGRGLRPIHCRQGRGGGGPVRHLSATGAA